MKIFLILLNLVSFFSVNAEDHSTNQNIMLKQFPKEDKNYTPGQDSGFHQYQTNSLNKTRSVVLSFDDGPHSINTPKVLDLLKSYQVKATFFVLTKNIDSKTLPIIERIVREGHILASHHHNHDDNNGKTREQYENELKLSVKLISQLNAQYGGGKELYYRFPFGAYGSRNLNFHHFNVMKKVSQELFGENCINFSFWDIDTLDWISNMSPSDIVSNVIANVIGGTAYHKKTAWYSKKPKKDSYTITNPMGGGVVLMHDIHDRTVEGLPSLLESLQKNSIKVVPLNEVEEYKFLEKTCTLL